MDVVNLFDEYHFKKRGIIIIEGELDRHDKRITLKTSKIKADGGFSDKDLGDIYNDLVDKKIRLEERLIEYQSFVLLIEDAMISLKEDNPIEYEAVKMRHIEHHGVFQIMTKLHFGRTQCWRVIKSGEKKLIRLIDIVK